MHSVGVPGTFGWSLSRSGNRVQTLDADKLAVYGDANYNTQQPPMSHSQPKYMETPQSEPSQSSPPPPPLRLSQL
eukprot:scaffold95060_cov59-Phaeocystis_antarctica.AAC.3